MYIIPSFVKTKIKRITTILVFVTCMYYVFYKNKVYNIRVQQLIFVKNIVIHLSNIRYAYLCNELCLILITFWTEITCIYNLIYLK